MINPAKIGFTFAFISAFSLLSVSTSAWAMPKSPGFVDADAKAIPVASFASRALRFDHFSEMHFADPWQRHGLNLFFPEQWIKTPGSFGKTEKN